MVGRIPEVTEIDDPDKDTNDSDDLRELITEVVQLAFQGGLFVDLRGDGLVDVTNSCALTGENNDSPCTSVDDSRTLYCTKSVSEWNEK